MQNIDNLLFDWSAEDEVAFVEKEAKRNERLDVIMTEADELEQERLHWEEENKKAWDDFMSDCYFI